MIDGQLGICPNCYGDVDAVGSINHIAKGDPVTTITWFHADCGYTGQAAYTANYFSKVFSPALQWWIRKDGERIFTKEENVVRDFARILDGVDNPADLEEIWGVLDG